jgi:predicted deacylase
VANPVSDIYYFSGSYDTARSRFRVEAQSAQGNGAKLWSYRVPSRKDSDLTVDYLYWPPQEQFERLIVITSGVHGTEAYAGSAVQLMFVSEFLSQWDHKKTGYLIVHALNPFGFKYGRRNTENNVNLNRNFSNSGEIFKTQNPEYAELQSVLEPRGAVGILPRLELPFTLVRLNRIKCSLGASWNDIGRFIGRGQFDSPAGLEYGGKEREPQVSDFLSRLIDISAKYSEIVLLDLHTGLGEAYQLHLMPGDAKRSVDADLFAQLFRPDQDLDTYRFTPNDANGFYETYGDLNNVIPELLTKEQRAVAVTMEFGTIGNGPLSKLQTINRLILENQGFQYGYSNDRIRDAVETAFQDLFYPREDLWRHTVIEKARQTFDLIGNRTIK